MTKKDTSMDRLADASLKSIAKYTTDEGMEVEIRKARTRDYPMVLKIARSIAAYIDSKTGGAVASGDVAAAAAKAEQAFGEMDQIFALIEDNMPLVLLVMESLTTLDKEGVENLSLEDMIGLSTMVWQVNQGFFMQVMAIISGFSKSTPQSPSASQNPATRKRARRS